MKLKYLLFLLLAGAFGNVYAQGVTETKRPDSVRGIPSVMQLVDSNGRYYLKGAGVPYTGRFMDYYRTGEKQSEGRLIEGRMSGLFRMYYPDGKVQKEFTMIDDVRQGRAKEYFSNGSVSLNGVFVNGREDGIWETYFPNGQVLQRMTYQEGGLKGIITYHSSGKVKKTLRFEGEHSVMDTLSQQIELLMKKAEDELGRRDLVSAAKTYTTCIGLDSSFEEAYYWRARLRLTEDKLDAAIADYDAAIAREPYYYDALTARAMARAGKAGLSESDKGKICADLQLGKMLQWESTGLDDMIIMFCGHAAGSPAR